MFRRGFRPRPSLSAQEPHHVRHADFAVSPGFRPRPSLSGLVLSGVGLDRSRFAGVQAPAFVERRWPRASCGFPNGFSPGFRPRPSLSAWSSNGGRIAGVSFAGVQAPAFVERGSLPPGDASISLVSPGFQAPAFVERSRSDRSDELYFPFRRGFRPRPSLSGLQVRCPPHYLQRFAGVSGPGLR